MKKKKVLTKKGLLLKIARLERKIKNLEKRITLYQPIHKKVEVLVPVFKLA